MSGRPARGLTLIEVLVAIAIVAILTGLAAPSFRETIARTRLEGAIHVRYPRTGERVLLLNEQTVEPAADTLLIADERRALALAGIMGGEDSGITLDTTEVFLESAFFAPEAIAGRARTYGFSSDASHRFERGVDFELPSWGTGEWEWQGFLTADEKPSDINPAQGYMTSWNNKPARDWHASDANYSFGSVHRVDSLSENLDAALMSATPLTIANMVEIMEDAGTTDLRGTQVLPLALALIGSEPGLDPILTIMQDWIDAERAALQRLSIR